MSYFSTDSLLQSAVNYSPVPFILESQVRRNEVEDGLCLFVMTTCQGKGLWTRRDLSGRAVRFAYDDQHAFLSMVRTLLQDGCDHVINLVVDQPWTALGELLGAR